MTRQRTSAEIEAGARAIYQNRSQTRWAWEELEPRQRQHFLAVAQDTLAAADAAAAPAVGVTVDEAKAMLRDYASLLAESDYFSPHSAYLDDEGRAEALRDKQKLERKIIALLTAQPGTHDAGAGE